MNSVRIEDRDDCVRVSTDYWEIEHLKRAGGAWNSLVFKNGSKQNILRGPLTSSLRVLRSETRPGDPYGYFSESNEPAPRINIETAPNGTVSIITEGTYRTVNGDAIPVGFRRRTDYAAHGLVWTTLNIMSDCGCGQIVEVRALGLALRAGMTDAFARFHPTQAGGADLLGGRTWIDLQRNTHTTPFLSRFTPLQVACFERGVEGLEVFPSSDLAQWDCGFKPDAGLGNFRIGHDASGASIELDPYCLASRRMPIRIQGTTTLRLGIALNDVKPRVKTQKPIKHAFLHSPNATDAEIELLAAEGVELICYRDDCREGGTFWHNGDVTPYNAIGMAGLRRVIDSCQRCNIKIVPYISSHELHPSTQAYDMHARDWMHSAARSLDVVHTWHGQEESGGLMCLRSGWLDYRKNTISAILNQLPWDGVCLDWPNPLPCCHPGHAAGPFHSDMDELLDLLFYCRDRIGPEKSLVFMASSESSIIAANLADHILPPE
ncbi:MAG: hypothetical protein WCT04_16295 [Planctomycetota bacterium]